MKRPNSEYNAGGNAERRSLRGAEAKMRHAVMPILDKMDESYSATAQLFSSHLRPHILKLKAFFDMRTKRTAKKGGRGTR